MVGLAVQPFVRPRYASLDHWRGVACLFVVLYHSALLYNTLPPARLSGLDAAAAWLLRQTEVLNVGVALFFVISGYCIAAAADGARLRGAGVRDYFIRRFRRIYPPLWIVIACSIAFFLLFDLWPIRGLVSDFPWQQPRPWWYSGSQWFGNLTLTETWRHHFFGDPRAHFPGQAWTLCYEEQFYLVTGLLIALRPRAFFPGVALVTAATLIIVVATPLAASPIRGFFFDGSWLLFAAGVAVYYRLSYARGPRGRAVDGVLWLAVPLSWWVTTPIAGATVGFAFAAALPALHRFDDRLAHAPALKPLLLCGRMCYSLYLVHQLPVKAVSALLMRYGITGALPTLFVTVPASVAVALAFGWLFYQTVERRFLNQPLAPAMVPLRRVV